MSVPTIAAAAAKTAAKRAKPTPRPYSGGSRRNIPGPGQERPATDASTEQPPAPEPAAADELRDPAPPPPRGVPSLPAAPGVVRDGAGVVLGFLVWVWVVLPYLDGGTARVRKVLKAKFVNEVSS